MISSMTEKLYREKAVYFDRPIISNLRYDYKVIAAHSPYDFTVAINDSTTSKYEKELKAQMDLHMERLKRMEKDDPLCCKIDSQLLFVGMPVLVKQKEGEGPGPVGSLVRGKVIAIRGKVMDILRVDVSGVVTRSNDDILPVSVDILRVPKLGISCRLGLIRPKDKGTSPSTWPMDRNYMNDFTGAHSQTISFFDYFPDSSTYDTMLEVDKVNVGLRYFHLDVALPAVLDVFETNSPIQSYPVSDFQSWLGLKVIVFGLRVFRDENEIIKCALQMDPDMVNTILDRITAYVETADKNAPFEKKIGAPCLAMYGGGEYFRSTILKKEAGDKYLVEYVDYREKQIVSASDLIALPPDLLAYPEGAVNCQFTDLLYCPNFKDDAVLEELVKEQDLYAVVDACDPDVFGRDLLVSLFKAVDFTGPDIPFSEILGIAERPPFVREILQDFEHTPQGLASLFLTSRTPDPDVFFPGAMVSVINSWDSIFLQLSDNIEGCGVISAELTRFYLSKGCPKEVKENFLEGKVIVKYVAARQEEDGDGLLHRAKIMEEKDGKLFLFYLDHGNSEWVEKERVWPLHKYFIKDALQTLEMGLK